jgi:hypothetical protein
VRAISYMIVASVMRKSPTYTEREARGVVDMLFVW